MKRIIRGRVIKILQDPAVPTYNLSFSGTNKNDISFLIVFIIFLFHTPKKDDELKKWCEED